MCDEMLGTFNKSFLCNIALSYTTIRLYHQITAFSHHILEVIKTTLHCLIDRQCLFCVCGGLICFIDSVRKRLTTAAACLVVKTAMEHQQATGTLAYGERWPMFLQAQTCTHSCTTRYENTHTQGLRMQQTCA